MPVLVIGFAVMFIGVGVAHFIVPHLFERIVPPVLPAPRLLVYISGVAEIAGGIGLLLPATRQWAAYGLIALLIAVYPANIYMAVKWREFRDLVPALWMHLVRLPLQFVMIGLMVWIATQ